MTRRLKPLGLTVVLLAGATAACVSKPQGVDTNPAALAQQAPEPSFDSRIERHSNEMLKAGRKIFRYDTFGSEEFWGGKLRLHEAIAGEKHGGVGPGVTARQALQLGLKVDIGALPKILVEAIRGRSVDLDKVETTLELLRANAVVGVTGFFDKDKRMTAMGIQCALCHSTVDDSLARGIGRRLDGWPNRDLNVGAIVASAPTLKPFSDLLGVDETTGTQGPSELGARPLRRRAQPRRQAVPPRRQAGDDGDAGSVRLGRRQPAHLFRLGLRHPLERVRGQHPDARKGDVLRPAHE